MCSDDLATQSGVARRLFGGGMLRRFFCFCKKKVTKEKQPRTRSGISVEMPRPFGVPNILEKDRATKTTRLAEMAFISRRQRRATLKQFSWKPPTLFQNIGAATREFSNATGCVKGATSKTMSARKKKSYWVGQSGNQTKKQNLKSPLPRRREPNSVTSTTTSKARGPRESRRATE